MNYIRNELLGILSLCKVETEEDKKIYITWLLEHFKNDIERQLEDLKYKQKELEGNLKTLEYVKDNLKH